MSAPAPPRNAGEPQRPQPTAIQHGMADSNATLRPETGGPVAGKPKKRRNRKSKKKKERKQSFAGTTDDGHESHRANASETAARENFYRLHGRNMSNTSIESEALLDHREQSSMRARRPSIMSQRGPLYDGPTSYRPQYQNPFVSSENANRNPQTRKDSGDESPGEDERAPLLSSRPKSSGAMGYGAYGGDRGKLSRQNSKHTNRKQSLSPSAGSQKRKTIFDRQSPAFPASTEEYNVNYPPSMPGSPTLGPASARDMSFGDSMMRDDFGPARASPRGLDNISEHAIETSSRRSTPHRDSGFERRHTIALNAEDDVCFPVEGLSEMGDEDLHQREGGGYHRGGRRKRQKYPMLSVLDEWCRFEKEGRSEERKAMKITEPELIAGRLRPVHKGWHRAEDDAPYRFCYFNESTQGTIHSQTISELISSGDQGGSFRELFIPDPPELPESSESESESEDENLMREESMLRHVSGVNGDSRAPTRNPSVFDDPRPESRVSSVRGHGSKSTSAEATPGQVISPPNGAAEISRTVTPIGIKSPIPKPQASPLLKTERPKRYGQRPIWWLDVLSPTEAEMKAIAKTFGIHPLTAEDIILQEAREKVELFRNYYFVSYRSFEQDSKNEDFLEPVNMYIVVFREGVLSFHFSQTPHPANVRRRVRQLNDYLVLSPDWISYALIDDITDVFAPLIQSIEDEVDDIDDAILKMHSPSEEEENAKKDEEKRSDSGDAEKSESGGDMLRRVGNCRKKVMGLYRLLGNKADVIKGFAKRCNEHWEVAPRSEIGLYLGDIQDHIVTMTGNLSHYEKILARSHGNYLAQINIRMNERQEQTADVLGKLTVLGTIVLPMNIITGLWGMNVWVPGQAAEGDLTWFWFLTAGLLVFGISCFFIAKLLYRIV